jgi:hypothetical protein
MSERPIDSAHRANESEHRHRRPRKKDFEGKTIKRFVRTADNIWKFWFLDGSSFAIQSDLHYGLAVMELCDVCIR